MIQPLFWVSKGSAELCSLRKGTVIFYQAGNVPFQTGNISQLEEKIIKREKEGKGSGQSGKEEPYLLYHPVIIATSAFGFPGFAVAFLGDKQDGLISYTSSPKNLEAISTFNKAEGSGTSTGGKSTNGKLSLQYCIKTLSM